MNPPKPSIDKKDSRQTDLTPLFYPMSIAHVGASERSAAGRFNFSTYLLNMNYPGKIFPVNPKYDQLFDLPCSPSLSAVPGMVDLAILAVPAERCVEVLQDAEPGKIKFVVIHTSGFGEIDKKNLEKTLLQMSRDKGFRIVGPNCMGIYSQEARVGFWQDHWELVKHPGAVSFISQSGGHAVNATLSGMDSGLSFNKVISLGNQIDVSINEVLEYMGDDDGTRVIGIYVEDIQDGKKFLALLKRIIPQKPVVVWKGGTSPVGKEAAVSHTGSLAGNERIFSAAMRQVGVLVTDNMPQMVRILRILQPRYPRMGGRLAVFSPGGGNTVNICDLFTKQPNLSLPRLSPETIDALKTLLPEENVDIRNPVDPGATGLLKMDKLIKAVGKDDRIDTLVILISVDYLSNIKSEESRLLLAEMISDTVGRLSKRIGKPVCILLRQERENHEDYDRYRRIMITKFNEKNVPWVDGSFKSAAEVFSSIAGYQDLLTRLEKRNS